MERKDLKVGMEVSYFQYDGADPDFGVITSLTAEVERKRGWRDYKKFNTGIEVTWNDRDSYRGATTVLDNAKKLNTKEYGESAKAYRAACRAAASRELAAEKEIRAALKEQGMKLGEYDVDVNSWGVKLNIPTAAWPLVAERLGLSGIVWK